MQQENETKHNGLPPRQIIMKSTIPLIVIACIARTILAGANANDNCHDYCYADVGACYYELSQGDDNFGNIPRGARADFVAGQTIEEPIRIVFKMIRPGILEHCKTELAGCLKICNLESGNM
ncbi:uncharacterized protein FIESC28_03795 [Fusarium coffeatum]|uniref:Uncharacterized protein n=1 Tax=Fusarium coffeatum TaxID=231269 RepID=A0A366S3S9_9HYPO|nr:uncharacterized protein FIESC28_03795 [Fusarium coffeatum]RBR23416.1 hypothetical protein FIESC28_03795 [Fusarium coffeatum]